MVLFLISWFFDILAWAGVQSWKCVKILWYEKGITLCKILELSNQQTSRTRNSSEYDIKVISICIPGWSLQFSNNRHFYIFISLIWSSNFRFLFQLQINKTEKPFSLQDDEKTDKTDNNYKWRLNNSISKSLRNGLSNSLQNIRAKTQATG